MAVHDTPTLDELLLAASRADLNQEYHWRTCALYGRMVACADCRKHQDGVLATDRALRDHFQAMCQGVA